MGCHFLPSKSLEGINFYLDGIFLLQSRCFMVNYCKCLGNNLNVIYQFNLKFEVFDILFFLISKYLYKFIIKMSNMKFKDFFIKKMYKFLSYFTDFVLISPS